MGALTMDEYINREAVYEDFEKCNSENPKWTPSRVKTLVARQKSADVAPVRHGRWIYTRKYGEYECSVCHGIDTDCSDYYSSHVVTEQDYCPNCGAKMDGCADIE